MLESLVVFFEFPGPGNRRGGARHDSHLPNIETGDATIRSETSQSCETDFGSFQYFIPPESEDTPKFARTRKGLNHPYQTLF